MHKPYFLESVAERILNLRKSHKNLAVIFPNRRAGLYLKKHIATRIEKPIFLPAIITIEDLLNGIGKTIKQDYLTQIMSLYDAYIEVARYHDDIDSFEQYLSWAPTFIKDCNDIDNALVDPHLFFQSLYEDKRMSTWSPGDDLTEIQKRYLAFWKDAENIYTIFTTTLTEKGGGYIGHNYRKAILALEENPTIVEAYDYYVFVGFNALNVAEERAIDLLTADDRGEIMWDIDDYYAGNDQKQYKAGKYYRKYKDRWNKTSQASEKKIGYNKTTINIIEAPNALAQCDIVFKLLEEKKSKGDLENLSSTAIILADEDLLEPLLLRLPESIDTYNITMGKSLNSFSLFHFIDRIIDIFHESDERQFTSESLINLASSPQMKILDSTNKFQDLHQKIIKNNLFKLEKQALMDDVDADFYQKLSKTPLNAPSILDFIQTVILRLRAHAYETKNRILIEILFEYKKLLSRLQEMATIYEVMTIQGMRRLYKSVAAQVKIPFEGEPLAGLQIMGLLESRMLDFDHIILLSANEGKLPESKHSQSFIPYIFKSKFGMPTYEEKDAIFAYSFYRLLHHPSQLDITYDSSSMSMGNNEKSRYLQQIEVEYLNKTPDGTSISHQVQGYETGQPLEYEYGIEKSPAIIDNILHYLTHVGLSPTSIATLIRSPLDFYLEKILGYKPPQDLETDLENNTYGTIIHETLLKLYTPLQNKKLTKDLLKGLEEQIEAKLQDEFIKVFGSRNFQSGYNQLLYNSAITMVQEVVNIDLQRIESHEIIILNLEEDIKSSFAFDYRGQKLAFKLKGQIDRIQRRDDCIEIIDYKSGKIDDLKSSNIKVAGTNYKQAKLQQLLTYTYMAHHRQDGTSYELENIRPALQGLRSWEDGLKFIDNDHYSLNHEVMQVFLSQILERIDHLLDPTIPFKPEDKNDILKYSNFLEVCGIPVP